MEPEILPAKIEISKDVSILAQVLKQGDESVEVYVVGGAVRDYLFNLYHGESKGEYTPKDVDISTNLSEDEILQRLRGDEAQRLFIRVKEKESVDTFGVVFVNINGRNYEVAPFRKDIGGDDGRHPDTIERGTIYDDAMRRDFTINNLYYDFEKKVILDFNPLGQGLVDIEKKIVRCVGDPMIRFQEDRLRVLRLVRFFARFNTGNINCFLAPDHCYAVESFKRLPGISSERIQDEFCNGIAQSMETASYLRNVVKMGLIPRLFPGMIFDTEHVESIGNLKNVAPILAFLLRYNRNVNRSLLELKYSSEISETVQFLINVMYFNSKFIFQMIKFRDKRLLKSKDPIETNGTTTQQLVDVLNKVNKQLTAKCITDLADLVDSPLLAAKLRHFSTYELPPIDSHKLMEQGFKGPAIGAEQERIAEEHYKVSFQEYLN